MLVTSLLSKYAININVTVTILDKQLQFKELWEKNANTISMPVIVVDSNNPESQKYVKGK